MAAVRTKTLAVGRFLAGPDAVLLYDCPAGETAIVKTIAAANLGGSLPTLTFEARRFGTEVPIAVAASLTIAAHYFERWVVLIPDDELWLRIGGGADVDVRVWVSGTELEGIAD